MRLPRIHPERLLLNDEVHARQPEVIQTPSRVTVVAMLTGGKRREEERAALADLAGRFGGPLPGPEDMHYSQDLGPFRVKWERHTEFTRYTIIVEGCPDEPFQEPAITAVPSDWVESLPGHLIMAAHLAIRPAARREPEGISARHFSGNPLVGSAIAGGAGIALTDFRIHPDGFSRFLVEDVSLSRRQAGRMVQRLLEMEAYRLMALLALPVARALVPVLDEGEGQLVEITKALEGASDDDEPVLLDRLTRLSGSIEGRLSDTHYRFSAAAAYHELVKRRIAELREERIQGLQTFQEFMGRRLDPALNTCRWVAARQRSISEGVARASQLLATRVDVTRQRQNQALLESMDRRATLQLRLQETVEGLSVAVITYYLVGLVGYAAKAAKALGFHLDVELIMGAAIPVAALAVALGVRRVRRMVAQGHEPHRLRTG
ncbi:MAG: DUF3422 domain-containing protein [Thermoanaerobaculia bacterium]|nr:DUF3422 domain-containing protein [Thermoanaerobaculia bacterium]